jgi:hypothetical protein
MRIRHKQLIGFLPLLILGIGLLAWFGPKAISMARYNHCSLRIRQKIEALDGRRPAAVKPKLWEESVGWLATAHCNICFSEEHASYEAMCRFEKQLDEKLKVDVDLGTIEWIGDRLAETGTHGQRYMTDWKIQWNALQEGGEREKQQHSK